MKILVAGALIIGAILAGPASAVTYYGTMGATSAYVFDWAQGATYTNYAFRTSTSTFAGSWRVDQGPMWSDDPVAYSGVEVAALLFGGSATDYFISTVDDDAANADRMAWVSTYGEGCADFGHCGTKVDQSFVQGTDTPPEVTATIPEPASWTLMITGFSLVGIGARRRRTALVGA